MSTGMRKEEVKGRKRRRRKYMPGFFCNSSDHMQHVRAATLEYIKETCRQANAGRKRERERERERAIGISI